LRFETALEPYSVKVSGHWTTVKIEPELKHALDDVARAEGRSVDDICSSLSSGRFRGSLASALRRYLLEYYRSRHGAVTAYGVVQEIVREMSGAGEFRLATNRKELLARRDLELDELSRSAARLRPLFEFWKQHLRTLPRSRDGGLVPILEHGLEPMVHVIDVRADDPDEFVILRQAPITVIYRRGDNVPLRALGRSLYSRELKTDYVAAKYRHAPSLQRLWARTAEGEIRYDRLILPSRSDGPTDRLIIGVAPIDPPAKRPS
jgi:predicted DNA-binding ribbon-helix-helix protein